MCQRQLFDSSKFSAHGNTAILGEGNYAKWSGFQQNQNSGEDSLSLENRHRLAGGLGGIDLANELDEALGGDALGALERQAWERVAVSSKTSNQDHHGSRTKGAVPAQGGEDTNGARDTEKHSVVAHLGQAKVLVDLKKSGAGISKSAGYRGIPGAECPNEHQHWARGSWSCPAGSGCEGQPMSGLMLRHRWERRQDPRTS
jgi:hypothetical protein